MTTLLKVTKVGKLHAAAARVDAGPRCAKHKMGKETTDATSRAEALALLVASTDY